MTKPKKTPKQIAEEHTDWFLDILRPILISFMEHGIKHGKKSKK